MKQIKLKKTDVEAIGCGLRDFFIAADGEQMLTAVQGLKTLLPDLPQPESADTLEFSFNRLFVGPNVPLAPPFASVYLEEDELVMGRTTLDARDFYASLGLTSPWQGQFPDDHISLEIDACLHYRRTISDQQDPAGTDLYRRFLQEHLLQWVPLFAERVDSAPQVSATIKAVADLTRTWLQHELTSTSQ